jgi:hypothetical protein
LKINGQEHLSNPEFYIGANGGITTSKIGFSPKVSQDFKLGINAGAVIKYITDRYFGIQAELNFSQTGWQEKNVNFNKTLNYIEIPFLTHIYFGKKARIFANIGPQISWLLGEKTNVDIVQSDEIQQITAIKNKFDYGFCIGLGSSIPFKKNVIQLEIRGNYGMGDIYSNAKEDKMFSRSNNLKASVNLAYLFKLR